MASVEMDEVDFGEVYEVRKDDEPFGRLGRVEDRHDDGVIVLVDAAGFVFFATVADLKPYVPGSGDLSGRSEQEVASH